MMSLKQRIGRVLPSAAKIKKLFLWGMAIFFGSTLLAVIILKWFPVYCTPLVVLRTVEYALDGEFGPVRKDWVALEDISPNLQMAVIASEDPKFLVHSGFDFEAITKAIKANKRRKVKMGASTITQQTAKNVFLYPSRTYLRKGLEVYFAVLMELIWGKKRILEVYLNVIELGHGIYGAEAASWYFWKKPAKNLSAGEAQLFAAVLPNPRRWSPIRPTPFALRRRNFIRRNIGLLGKSYFKPLYE